MALDEEVVAWLERGALPGGFLLTVPSLEAAFLSGGLEPSILMRMKSSLELIVV